ncbi:DUF4097 family beta strand repeat-containing protein [Candidatus Borrarchaeum sp.]|uniref:DUF4097 family beta strand repeat-containing protein n=1 Tax=Candidatus Borrarchaeum sp. TaxID=2846742 RepID=UPI00257B524D|nr:DUF4097 family beta strand repeat-containing protein [Candidatus Borrarchaeum sp.]
MVRKYRIALVMISILFTMSFIGCVQPTVAQFASEEFQQTYDVEAGTVLTVDNQNGDIIVEGWNNDDVEVYAEKVTQYGQSELDKVSIEVTTGNEMTVKTTYTNLFWFFRTPRVTVNYWIKVPADVSVEHLETTNGGISLEGTTGDTTLISTNGNINVKDVDGYVDAETTNGGITIEDVTSVRGTETTNGRIIVEIPSLSNNVEIKTTNGAITAYVSEDLNADLSMSTTNGVITIHDVQLDLESSSATSVEGTMGDGGYDLTITNTNGNIDLYKL